MQGRHYQCSMHGPTSLGSINSSHQCQKTCMGRPMWAWPMHRMSVKTLLFIITVLNATTQNLRYLKLIETVHNKTAPSCSFRQILRKSCAQINHRVYPPGSIPSTMRTSLRPASILSFPNGGFSFHPLASSKYSNCRFLSFLGRHHPTNFSRNAAAGRAALAGLQNGDPLDPERSTLFKRLRSPKAA